MLFLGIVFLFPGGPTADATAMNYSVVVVGGIMILSLLWYYCPKYGGVHWFKGPIPNIELGADASGESARPSETDSDEKHLDLAEVQEK
jgi:hypothetical protein